MKMIKICLLMIVSLSGGVVSWAQDEAQQFEGFNLQGYTEDGDKSWDVNGDTADILGNTIEISNVDANRYGEQVMNLKAKKGTIDKASGNIHLEKDVVITSQSGTRFVTDTLDWEKNNDLVRTDDRVYITDLEKGMDAKGTGLIAHPNLKTAQMNRDVEVNVKTEPEDPDASTITVTCEGPMEIDQKRNMAVFNENVIAVQEDRTLQADICTLYFDPETEQIKRMICVGNVLILQGENSTISERVVYNADTQKLTLSGRPKLIMVTEGEGGLAPLKGGNKSEKKPETNPDI